jgi:hypothetical protein
MRLRNQSTAVKTVTVNGHTYTVSTPITDPFLPGTEPDPRPLWGTFNVTDDTDANALLQDLSGGWSVTGQAPESGFQQVGESLGGGGGGGLPGTCIRMRSNSTDPLVVDSYFNLMVLDSTFSVLEDDFVHITDPNFRGTGTNFGAVLVNNAGLYQIDWCLSHIGTVDSAMFTRIHIVLELAVSTFLLDFDKMVWSDEHGKVEGSGVLRIPADSMVALQDLNPGKLYQADQPGWGPPGSDLGAEFQIVRLS